MVGVGRRRLWAVLFCGLRRGRVAGEAEAMDEENPDDAALENSGIGVTPPWPCICHAQLENVGEETPSTLFCTARSCQQKLTNIIFHNLRCNYSTSLKSQIAAKSLQV